MLTAISDINGRINLLFNQAAKSCFEIVSNIILSFNLLI